MPDPIIAGVVILLLAGTWALIAVLDGYDATVDNWSED